MAENAARADGMAPQIVPSSRWKQVLSIGLALVLTAWVLSRLELSAFLLALSRINHVGYLAFMFAFLLLLLVADSAAIAYVYARYVCKVQFKEVCILRGGSYLPSVVNYHIGQAWLTWFASRVYGATLSNVAGATLLNYATMFGSLAFLGALAYPLAHNQIPWLRSSLSLLACAAMAYAVVIAAKPRRLARVPGAQVLLDAGIAGHLAALAFRLPHMVILFLGMWLPFGFFDVSIPLGDALAYVPILMLVGALPITPQGVGTRDVIAVNLLFQYAPPHAAKETIIAATLCWAITLTLMQLLVSPVFLLLARRLFRNANDARLATSKASN